MKNLAASKQTDNKPQRAHRFWGWCVIFFALLFTTLPSYATTIDPLLWEQMAVACDFAGIVECTTAGGIVAEYKVIETWKGTEHSEPIRINVAVNYWEPQFPMTLIGEQYLIFAYKNNAYSRVMSTTSGGPVPLWLRDIEYDYRLPLFQGRYLIDNQQQFPSYEFRDRNEGFKKISVIDIKKRVKELVDKSEPEQEILLLKTLFNKYFITRYSQRHKSDTDRLNKLKLKRDTGSSVEEEVINELTRKTKKYEMIIAELSRLNQKIQPYTDSIQLIDAVFDFSLSDFKEHRHCLRSVLEQGILTDTSLEHLKDRIAATNDSAIDGYVRRSLPERIQARIDSSLKQPYQRKPKIKTHTPTPEEMEKYRAMREDHNKKTYTPEIMEKHRAMLEDYNNADKYKWSKSFKVLSEQQPIFTAKWLAKWENPHKEKRNKNVGYELGSWMAYCCKKDKLKCLKILLDAKEPYVRVAGAVYLCFENEKQGSKQLKKLQKLKGDPGRWAALNLARRGDKKAMERLIWSLPGVDLNTSGMDAVPRRNLVKRMTVLLSNSAADSNVSQPPNLIHKSVNIYNLTEWWDEHKDKITLRDPWLDILREQKVD